MSTPLAWRPSRGLVLLIVLYGLILGGAGLYWAGQAVGERTVSAGLSNVEYQELKWAVRGGVLGTLGMPVGGIVLVGFENKFYSSVP